MLGPFFICRGLSDPVRHAARGWRRVGRYPEPRFAPSPQAISPEHLDLLEAIGRQLGMSIQNARLFEKLRQELAERKRAEAEDL